MAEPLSPLHFNDAQIRFTAHLPGQASPESLLVASLHTDAMHEAAVFAATGRAMAAAPLLLVALKDAVEVIRSWHGPEAWDIYRDHAPEMKRINAAILAAQGERVAGTPAFTLPPMDEAVAEILGRPNFMCAQIAQVLRASGMLIARKAEAEQAAVLYFLLTQYAEHGVHWYERSTQTLRDMVEAARSAEQGGAA